MNQEGSKLRTGLLFRRIVDEGLLLDLEEDLGYRLNDVGVSIVSLLSEGIDGVALIDRLCAEYEIDRDRCTREVSDFLDDLQARGLIRDG